jgi:hypothetical protein
MLLEPPVILPPDSQGTTRSKIAIGLKKFRHKSRSRASSCHPGLDFMLTRGPPLFPGDEPTPDRHRVDHVNLFRVSCRVLRKPGAHIVASHRASLSTRSRQVRQFDPILTPRHQDHFLSAPGNSQNHTNPWSPGGPVSHRLVPPPQLRLPVTTALIPASRSHRPHSLPGPDRPASKPSHPARMV